MRNVKLLSYLHYNTIEGNFDYFFRLSTALLIELWAKSRRCTRPFDPRRQLRDKAGLHTRGFSGQDQSRKPAVIRTTTYSNRYYFFNRLRKSFCYPLKKLMEKYRNNIKHSWRFTLTLPNGSTRIMTWLSVEQCHQWSRTLMSVTKPIRKISVNFFFHYSEFGSNSCESDAVRFT